MSEVTITGNVTSDPTLTYTSTGQACCNFRVARTERYRDGGGQWKDGDTIFIGVTAWRELAEAANEALVKGQRVTVSGRLRSRTFEDTRAQLADGTNVQRQVTEIMADDVAISVKATRSGSSQSGGMTTREPPPF